MEMEIGWYHRYVERCIDYNLKYDCKIKSFYEKVFKKWESKIKLDFLLKEIFI